MTRDKVLTAIAEAERFIDKAKAIVEYGKQVQDWIDPSKESGAARRASMDLTRALADMRRVP